MKENPSTYRILLVEDDPGDAYLVREMLAEATSARFDVVHADRLGTALAALGERAFDVILEDLSLPDAQGLEIITRLTSAAPNAPIVILSGQDNEELSLTAVQHGAQDYLVKGRADSYLLARAIRYAVERKHAQDELRIKALLLDAATDSIFLHDMTGRFVYVNDTACTSRGYTKDELLGMNLRQLNDPLHAPPMEPSIKKLQEEGRGVFESVHVCKDGTRMPVELHSRIIEAEGGKLILSIARDVRERKRAERELQQSHEQISALYRVSAACSRSININDLLTEVLDAVNDIKLFDTGRKAGVFQVENGTMELLMQFGGSTEFVGMHKGMKVGDCLCGLAAQEDRIIVSDDSLADDRHTLRYPDMDRHGHVIVPLRSKGRVLGVLYLYTAAPVSLDEKTTAILRTVGDQIGISMENALLYKQTEDLALHDPLTGLGNRRYLEILFEKAFASARRGGELSVIMFDIDHFKRYNDTYGHDAGDKKLVAVAHAASKETREANIMARYGGEEFLMILPDTGLPDALAAAERIRKVIEAEAGITVSLGVASYDGRIGTKEDLIRKADEALYRAKQNGRNRVER